MPKVSSCYKVKSNMMHKFYSEPVAALDLRLTKNEASLFGMEANPLDVDVKEEEAFEAKEVLPPDCQDVQGSLSPPASTPLSPPPRESAKQEEDLVLVENPWDIQHVTLHIARSPVWQAEPATGWSQTQVEKISSSSLFPPPSPSPSPSHDINKDPAPHHRPVIEDWQGYSGRPSSAWRFPRPRDQDEANACLMSVPGNSQNYQAFHDHQVRSTNALDHGHPDCSRPDLSSRSPAVSPKFSPLQASYYTTNVCQPHPPSQIREHLVHEQEALSHQHSPKTFSQRLSTNIEPHRRSVIMRPAHHQSGRSTYLSEVAKGNHGCHPSIDFSAHPIKQEDFTQPLLYNMDCKPNLQDLKDPEWLNKIQQLRTDFAFQMFETRRLQNCEPQRQLFFPQSLHLLSHLSSPREHGHSAGDQEGEKDHDSKSGLDLVNTILHRMEDPRSERCHENLPCSTTLPGGGGGARLGKRGRPRKHAPKIPLPPLYVFIRNLLYSAAYNPSAVAWVDQSIGCFKVFY